LPVYGHMQGVDFRPGDSRFEGRTPDEAVTQALADPDCFLVNSNRGSGSRGLIDGLLAGRKPPGHAVEARSHNAVAAAVEQGRADWGVAIASVASAFDLAFLPRRDERYDFAIPEASCERPAVAAFRDLIGSPEVRRKLAGREL